jgi:hypothetical protein
MDDDALSKILGRVDFVRKTESLNITRKRYTDWSLFVDYDASMRCSAVEVYDGNVMFRGFQLSSLSYRDLVKVIVEKVGSEVLDLGDGFRCDGLGLACYAPGRYGPEGDDAAVEALLAYRVGYYGA